MNRVFFKNDKELNVFLSFFGYHSKPKIEVNHRVRIILTQTNVLSYSSILHNYNNKNTKYASIITLFKVFSLSNPRDSYMSLQTKNIQKS